MICVWLYRCQSAVSLAIVAQSAGPLSREIRIPAHTYEYSAYCCDCLLVSCWQTWSRGSVGRDRMRIRDSATPTINILHNWETATRRPQRTIGYTALDIRPAANNDTSQASYGKISLSIQSTTSNNTPFLRMTRKCLHHSLRSMCTCLVTSWSFYVSICMYVQVFFYGNCWF